MTFRVTEGASSALPAATTLAALSPKGTVRIVLGSGHNIHEDARAEVVAAIERMLVAAADR
jgi:pimeloyl-ACP methyl ester carboxylesterase